MNLREKILSVALILTNFKQVPWAQFSSQEAGVLTDSVNPIVYSIVSKSQLPSL